MTPTAYETITLDLSDGIATLTLNRPDKLNAFTTRMRATGLMNGHHPQPSVADFVIPQVLALSYTAHDLAPFARDLGYVDAQGQVLPRSRPFPQVHHRLSTVDEATKRLMPQWHFGASSGRAVTQRSRAEKAPSSSTETARLFTWGSRRSSSPPPSPSTSRMVPLPSYINQ